MIKKEAKTENHLPFIACIANSHGPPIFPPLQIFSGKKTQRIDLGFFLKKDGAVLQEMKDGDGDEHSNAHIVESKRLFLLSEMTGREGAWKEGEKEGNKKRKIK
jgi:hypothetical protein